MRVIFKNILMLLKNISVSIRKIITISFSIVRKTTNRIVLIYCSPSRWQRLIWNKKGITSVLCGVFIFLCIGIVLNGIWVFNLFYLFLALFSIILIVALLAECKYTKSMDAIRALTNHMEGFQETNSFFTKQDLSKIFAIIPCLVVLVFGIGGGLIYGNIVFTPTLIWCLCFFAITVHISIIGYLQYIILFIYLKKIAYNSTPYINLLKSTTHFIPSEVDWLQQLAKISHMYRNIFFSLGSLYIFAFACFCFIPVFNVAIGHIIFFILWGIIFSAIVVLFPLVSILEFYWIKMIVKKVKQSYIKDLIKESSMFEDAMPKWINPSINMMKNVFASTINNSQSYPVPNKLGISYAVIVAVINLIASIATVIEFAQKISLFS